MSKKGETAVAQEQPYDSTFKALLDDVTLPLLSFLFGEEILFAQELNRTTKVTQEDKRRVGQTMIDEFRSLLDEGYFVQKRVAESRAEGEAKGREEGLQEAVLMVTELRFPTLLDLAHKQVKRAKGPEALRLVLKGVTAASSEEYARLLLDLLAA